MLLEVVDLHSGYYEDILILQGVSLSVPDQQIITIIGANGVGKSTLLKTIFGFLRIKNGRILYQGEDITKVDSTDMVRKGISYIPQRRHAFPYLTVEENLKIGCWVFRDDRDRTAREIQEAYSRYPILGKKRKEKAVFMSGGEQRVLEIGMALLTDPRLLLVDEPTAGLAPKISNQIYTELQRLQREEKKAILLVDQNIRKGIEVADYIYVLELGRNKMQGTKEEFKQDSKKIVRGMLF